MKRQLIQDRLREWGSKEPDIQTVYMYGSRPRGDYGKNSDLDIAITLDRKQAHIDGFRLWFLPLRNTHDK